MTEHITTVISLLRLSSILRLPTLHHHLSFSPFPPQYDVCNHEAARHVGHHPLHGDRKRRAER